MSYHENWQPAWRNPEIKKEYDAIIVGGGGHGLTTAYYLAKIHGVRNIAIVEIVKCNSQVGSGSLPNELFPSFGISIKNKSNKRDGLFPIKLSKALRELPIPIISRIKGGSVILDLRCLEKENIFVEQFNSLKIKNFFNL